MGDEVEVYSVSKEKWYRGRVVSFSEIPIRLRKDPSTPEYTYFVTYRVGREISSKTVVPGPFEVSGLETHIRETAEHRDCEGLPAWLPAIGRRLANRRNRDSPVLLRLLEETREAN